MTTELMTEAEARRHVRDIHDHAFAEWYAECEVLAADHKKLLVRIGDHFNRGEQLFGEQAAQAYDLFELAHETLQNYISYTRRVPPSVRPATGERRIGISTLGAVAPLANFPQAQKTLLTAYAAGQIKDRDELRQEVKRFAAEAKIELRPASPTWETVQEWSVPTKDWAIATIFRALSEAVQAIGTRRCKLVLLAEKGVIDKTTDEITQRA